MAAVIASRRKRWWAARPAVLGAAYLTALFVPIYTTITSIPAAWWVDLEQPPCSVAQSPLAAEPPAPLLPQLSPLLAQEVDRKLDPFRDRGISRDDIQVAHQLQKALGESGPAL